MDAVHKRIETSVGHICRYSQLPQLPAAREDLQQIAGNEDKFICKAQELYGEKTDSREITDVVTFTLTRAEEGLRLPWRSPFVLVLVVPP